MLAYIIRRLLLIIPTLFGILLINFVIIQAAPGGPVEQMIAKLEGFEGATSRIAGGGAEVAVAGSSYRGAQGLDPALIKEIETMYGFDKSAPERLWIMVKNYARLDFGDSFFRDAKVIDLIKEKMPVSISLGLWSTLIMYLVSIPLGIAKATRHGSHFDVWTSSAIIVGYAIPAFLFAILLIVVFAGGSYFDWFPLRGLTSNNFDELSWGGKILDYFWHLALPITALVIGNFATMTLLTKNSFLDEINKQYVVTAKAKGLTNHRVLYGHVFRNAMLLVIAGFPSAFIGIFFTGSLLVEVIFSLDGLGLMSFEAAINRDYPVVFGTLFIFTLLGLVVKLIGDLTYTLVDPRIDFARPDHLDQSVPPQSPPVRAVQGKQTRLVVAVAVPDPVRPEPGRRADRQRQTAGGALRRRLVFPGAQTLPGNHLRRRVPPGGQLQEPVYPGAAQGQGRVDAVGADPVQLSEHQLRPEGTGPRAAVFGQPAGHR